MPLGRLTALVIGCAVAASAGAVSVRSAPSASHTAAGFVSVSGHRMYYECSGVGSPTVVLDAGSPDTSTTWRWVQPQIARVTRVCAYDRAGLGQSSPAPAGRRTAKTQVEDLRALLTAARIPPPYILVGHSWGGLLARIFAHAYPHATGGVVLVDATTFPYLTPATAARLPRKKTREGITIAAAVAESDAVTALGSIPLIVLGSNEPPLDAKLRHAQDEEAALSTDSINAVARHSTHYIQRPAPLGQPQVVIDAVTAVVTAARTHRALPHCGRLFATTAVTCR
ncbi:MAG TPA: alpha/beta hydrolase [Gaiellaceae bacterium]|nr:alpha/beta hydrolase [Gaiellaceae bacterium]